MGAVKRKEAPGGDNPSKKAKASKDSRPTKREQPTKFKSEDRGDKKKTKTENEGEKKSKAVANDAPAPVLAQPSVVSVLKEEEAMFPRGGGGVLTPLEMKQIQIDAKADALKEEEELFDTEEKTKSKKERKKKSKFDSVANSSKDEDAVKIDSLNFKRMIPGSVVLGQITEVGYSSLTISLPNNLSGTVSMAAISSTITTKLEKMAEASNDGSDEESDEDDDFELKSMFAIGQYVRTYVLSTKDEEGAGKAKRKIELSLRPNEANSGMSKGDVVPNATVMAAVVTVQDHGFEMELGIGKNKLKGFLPKKEVGSDLEESRLQPGAVALCLVKSVSGSIVQLTADPAKLSKIDSVPGEATTVNSFQPGTAADILITSVTSRGVVGALLGHLPVTADLIHSGAGPDGVDLETKYKVGSRVKARIICTFPAARTPKLGMSLLPHITRLSTKSSGRGATTKEPLSVLPIGAFVEKCTVRHVEPDIGLYVDIGVQGLSGFVHISRVKDGKVDALYETSGPFKPETVHRGRVVGYSQFDGVFLLSLEQSVLDQRFLRLEDVPAGEVVNGTIEKVIVGASGVSGILVKIAEGLVGLVHETHLADVRLQHPERKFREGMSVKARVLSVRPKKRQMRLTLKKTLVNSDLPIVQDYEDVAVGSQALCTISDISAHGARVEFYKGVRGFLPVAQMSEAYIQDPKDHFKIGQVLNVHIIDAEPETRKIIVSCKDPSAFGADKQNALKALSVGSLVTGKVSQKTDSQVSLELEGSGLKATLAVGHLTDNSEKKNESALKRIHAGQTLSNLVVLDKNDRRRAIILSQKPSLVEAAKEGKLLRGYGDAKVGDIVPGYVSNIHNAAVLIQFGGNLTGVMFKAKLPKEDQEKPNFGLRKHQSIKVAVSMVKEDLKRLVVVPAALAGETKESKPSADKPERPSVHGPVKDITFGQTAEAQIVGIHDTQLNVETTDKVQGRVDVSQIFDSWDKIKDPAQPLAQFKKGDTLTVRAMGLHDAKDHRFLAFSHRSFNSVVEFTAKPSDLTVDELKPLSLGDIKANASYPAFINNVSRSYLWVNLSPVVRGRINAIDASDDINKISNLEDHFEVGSAIQVRVVAVDAATNRLDLTARSSTAPAITWDTLKPNQVLPGSVSKVNERQVVVKLTPTISGAISLVDMSDDFSDVNTLKYNKGEAIQVSVVEVDKSNKRIRLSTRASRVLNSDSAVADKEITSFEQITSGSIIRGFVKHVGDKGVFVTLGGKVTALVKISNLSDRYLKDWKEQFQVDQLVKGRVISVDAGSGRVELNLKGSVVDDNYKPASTYADFHAGQIVTGKIRKVEEFGAFVVVDGSDNVSGLCHRSEMADKPVKDARKLYQEGDKVKAKILSVDATKKRISFGLKPAYFDDEDTDMEDNEGADLVSSDEEEVDSDEGEDLAVGGAPISFFGTDNQAEEDDEDEDEDEESVDEDGDVDMSGLDAAEGGKYDWTGDAFDDDKKKAKKASKKEKTKEEKPKNGIQIDKTADLDTNGPQTTSDYERLLLGQPDSSALWIAYMAHQMQVSELSKARDVAERALKTINIREETEKLNVWTAYLNLEAAYGTNATCDEVFQRACQYNDPLEVHERLATIFIQANKHRRADELFQTMMSKFGSKSPEFWANYAHFLHVTRNLPDRARALLPRASQALGEKQTAALMAKFGALEFHSPNGDAERGRTTYETILATWPKRFDFWNQLADLEISAANPDTAAIRDVFERGAKVKGLKPQRAMKWFKRWAAWEEKLDPKGKERVMAKAQEWVAAAQAKKGAAAEADEDDE
ncbi:rRNA biogenesis protein RRP5 [Plectosphaerella cucumerina]|uniref:rRNA biogenesis protein RRP5 n=1 Tax=Plectosphaerella cucumerina TaxID=40658 RepID=A0A8K0TGC0_9PEZI|nr:rRNA biogenesis protein RRP5 [Plectosphaerella cucumerina]